jgi:hypothetical protein
VKVGFVDLCELLDAEKVDHLRPTCFVIQQLGWPPAYLLLYKNDQKLKWIIARVEGKVVTGIKLFARDERNLASS